MLNFTDFALEGGSNCLFDYVEIRLGTFLNGSVSIVQCFVMLSDIDFSFVAEMEAMKRHL